MRETLCLLRENSHPGGFDSANLDLGLLYWNFYLISNKRFGTTLRKTILKQTMQKTLDRCSSVTSSGGDEETCKTRGQESFSNLRNASQNSCGWNTTWPQVLAKSFDSASRGRPGLGRQESFLDREAAQLSLKMHREASQGRSRETGIEACTN